MMGMEPPPPPESRASMIQQAKQELQMLEAQQPNKFNYLKLELNQFITQMEILESVDSQNSTTSYAATQASTTGRKERSLEKVQESLPIVICLPCPEKIQRIEKDEDDDDDDDKAIGSKPKYCRVNSCEWYERMDRVDEVIRRAEACLLKVQQFKTEFRNDGLIQ